MEHQQLAAMQETLSQLSALNNDAFAEAERTAQRLAEPQPQKITARN